MKKNVIFVLLAAGMFVACGEATEAVKEITTEAEKIVEEITPETEVEVEEDAPANAVFEETPYLVYGPMKDFEANGWMFSDSIAPMAMKGESEMVVKANVHQICGKAGCWISVMPNSGEEVMVFFKDHFTIPIDGTTGKQVVFHGVAKMDTTSVDMQKHLLDDRKDAGEAISQEQYDAITGPIYEPIFIADGIMVPSEE